MRALCPLGSNSTASPMLNWPSSKVPVTTVPKPLRLKTRSTGSRGRARLRRAGNAPRVRARVLRKSIKPLPVVALTRTSGALARWVACNSSATSNSTNSSHSGSSTRSTLVNTTTAAGTASKSRIARCSRVCGITPSSAAMINMAASIPPTPANIFLMKSIWPGTSTIPTASVWSAPAMRNSIQAKPRSIVIPRRFSSCSRSGSMPERARTRVDLP